jgi:hypothetical protein
MNKPFKMKFLIVDDSAPMRRSIKDLLPAAHGESDKLVGLATAAGFAVAAFLTFTG